MTSFRATSALLFAAAFCLVAASVGADEASAPARLVVESTSEQVLAVLRDKGVSVDRRLEELQQIAYRRFDFPTIGRLVLARGWNQLTPDQQRAFLEDFKRHLSLDYGRRIDSYTNQTVTIIGDRTEPNGDATVRTQVNGGGTSPVAVDYRLRRIDGDWRVIDIIVEGVSLVSSYRSQFQEIMASGGPTRLLQVLREKNEQAATTARAG
ncbi:MAG: ABC transporter substrate-binding protein [Deltaproteobacteria bacterium]|nr:ABC transporter substrate-binding protein [Deltaproteobacteria bacterium]